MESKHSFDKVGQWMLMKGISLAVKEILFYHLLYLHHPSNYEPLVDGDTLMGDVYPMQASQTADTTVPLGITMGQNVFENGWEFWICNDCGAYQRQSCANQSAPNKQQEGHHISQFNQPIHLPQSPLIHLLHNSLAHS